MVNPHTAFAFGGLKARNGRALEIEAPDFRQMERIKRRLDHVVSLIAPARAVALLGLPRAADIEGQLRVEGLESLLAANGIAIQAGTASDDSRTRSATIWLGDAPEEVEARRRHPPPRLLLWPRPERVAEACALVANWNGPPPILCLPTRDVEAAGGGLRADVTCMVPDPAHALWGLLDHHPRGEGILELPDGGWDGMLPTSRLAMLRWCERTGSPSSRRLGLRLRGPARRRVLEAVRRRVVGHAAASGKHVGGSILAALLGRRFRVAPDADLETAARIAAYWEGWKATTLAARG